MVNVAVANVTAIVCKHVPVRSSCQKVAKLRDPMVGHVPLSHPVNNRVRLPPSEPSEGEPPPVAAAFKAAPPVTFVKKDIGPSVVAFAI